MTAAFSFISVHMNACRRHRVMVAAVVVPETRHHGVMPAASRSLPETERAEQSSLLPARRAQPFPPLECSSPSWAASGEPASLPPAGPVRPAEPAAAPSLPAGPRFGGRRGWVGRGAGTAAAARGGTTGTNLNDATSSSRRLSGSLLVSFSSLPVISHPAAEHRHRSCWLFPGYRPSRASAPGSAVHVASGTLATGPFLGRANTYLSFFPPRTAVPRTRHPTAVTCPALFLRQEAPIPSLRVCGSNRHHTESKDNDRCTIDRLKSHADLLPPRGATTDPLVTHGQHPFCAPRKPSAWRHLRTVRRRLAESTYRAAARAHSRTVFRSETRYFGAGSRRDWSMARHSRHESR